MKNGITHAMKSVLFHVAAFACVTSGLCINGCTEPNVPGPGAGHDRVRLYDDTLADPRNHAIRIVAGAGRLLMTYGRTFEQVVMVFGTPTTPPPARSVWMLTDNAGSLIRRDTLPAGLNIGDAIALPGNNFLIVTFTGVPSLWGGPKWGLHITRIDHNGMMGSVDSLDVPNIPAFNQISNIHLYPAPNRNVLLYFDYQDANYQSGNFIGEMDVQGNFLWYKELGSTGVDDCVMTPDGGFMVSAVRWDQSGTRFIMKTNGTFDSSWTRLLVPVEGTVNRIQIASAENGSYRLHYLAWHDGRIYLYKMSVNGEIIDSTNYVMPNFEPFFLSTVMLPYGPSGLFISHSLGIVYNTVSDQYNSMYVILDENLSITRTSVYQNQTSDKLNSACRTSDGRIACFGIIQCHDRRYYKPELIIVD